MTAFITNLILGAWKEILAGLGVIVGLFMARQSGINKERRKAAEGALDRHATARRVSDEIDRANAAADDRDADRIERMRRAGDLRD